ncbi:hypothetical protein E2C01_006098 [Portunus trituberculatus]|uniref:Uncharacterized protein n=1 Tax=Portunus trituberculatus TaxID=210409 RepID=A0A5B7CW66_PORTR|nr:hypothetical protein [Portunus trituberculatus]
MEAAGRVITPIQLVKRGHDTLKHSRTRTLTIFSNTGQSGYVRDVHGDYGDTPSDSKKITTLATVPSSREVSYGSEVKIQLDASFVAASWRGRAPPSVVPPCGHQRHDTPLFRASWGQQVTSVLYLTQSHLTIRFFLPPAALPIPGSDGGGSGSGRTVKVRGTGSNGKV